MCEKSRKCTVTRCSNCPFVWRDWECWMREADGAVHLCKSYAMHTISIQSWCLLIQTVLRVLLRRWQRRWVIRCRLFGEGGYKINKHQILLSLWLSVFWDVWQSSRIENCGTRMPTLFIFFLSLALDRIHRLQFILHALFLLSSSWAARAHAERMKCQILLQTCPKPKYILLSLIHRRSGSFFHWPLDTWTERNAAMTQRLVQPPPPLIIISRSLSVCSVLLQTITMKWPTKNSYKFSYKPKNVRDTNWYAARRMPQFEQKEEESEKKKQKNWVFVLSEKWNYDNEMCLLLVHWTKWMMCERWTTAPE